MKRISVIVGVLALALLVSGCTTKSTPAAVPAESTLPGETSTTGSGGGSQIEMSGQQDATASGAGEVVVSQESENKISLNAKNFTFGVNKVTVKKGSKLVFAVKNEQGFHDLLIDELKVNSGNIPEGETVELEIPTDTVGEFEYYCSVGQHRQMGMKGLLVIEE